MIIMPLEIDLKAALGKNLVSLGARVSEKLARKGEANFIVAASNCPEEILNDLRKTSVKVETFSGTGKQLGIFCGKPFPVAALAVKVEKKKK